MAENTEGYQQYHDQKRFLGEIEQGIRLANREIIHGRIPGLSKETILTFAVAVGRLRARYLQAAMRISVNEAGDPPEDAEIAELRAKREMYEEARLGFEALRDAIEKGYIDAGGLD